MPNSLMDYLMAGRGGFFGGQPTSPLGAMVANQRPDIPGFNTQPVAQPGLPVPQLQEPPPGPFGGVLGRVFAGQDDPSLTREQNDSIRRQAILNAGLAMLAGNQSDTQIDTLGSALARGAAVGQGTAGQLRTGLQEIAKKASSQRVKAEIADALEGGLNAASADRMLQIALREDAPMETLELIADLRSEIESPAGRDLININIGDGRSISAWSYPDGRLEDVFSGEPLERPEPTPDDPLKGSFTRAIQVDPATGEPTVNGVPHEVRFSAGGLPIRILGPAVVPAVAGAGPTIQQIEAANQAVGINRELGIMTETMGAVRDVAGAILPGWGRALKTDERQRFEGATQKLGQIAQKLQSGATSTEQEFGRILLANIPQLGEKEGSINDKIGRIQLLIQSFENIARGQFPPGFEELTADSVAGGLP